MSDDDFDFESFERLNYDFRSERVTDVYAALISGDPGNLINFTRVPKLASNQLFLQAR